jgi:two-component system cell cycle sensor histidine kinase/response regulator CckA
MPSLEDRSLVLLSGTVSGDIQIRSGSDARFSLACGGDLLYVRAFEPKQIRVCQALRDRDRVVVVGSLHSFVYKRCRSHHAWVKALAVAPGSGENLVDELPGLFGLWWESESEATGIARSITESSLTERLLAEYEERCRHASEVTATYVYTLHARGGAALAIDWLRACIAPIGGITLDQVEDDWRQVVHPNDVEMVSDHLHVLASGRPHTAEFRVVIGNGETRWLRDDARPVQEEGQLIRIYGVVQDITDRKWLESQVLELHKMATVNRLAGGIAHEFNNLLTIIMSRAELLLYRLHEPDSAVRGDVEEITGATKRAAWLTHQLLAFTRRQMVLPELLDLNGVIANLGEMLRRVIGEGVQLVIVTGLEEGYVKADRGQVEQMLINFAIHACDRMPKGGHLTLETAGVILDEAQSEQIGLLPGPYVRLVVSDTGPEMGRAELARLDGDLDDDRSHVGLPLACRMAGLIGAHVQVSSRPGATTFSVYLPLVSEVGAVVADRQTYVAPSQPETVLVVEDEDRVRSLVCQVLQLNGYQVLQARSGEEALEVFRQHQETVHLVVTDVMLPGMNGLELVDRLMEVRPQIKAIFISGYVDVNVSLDDAPPGSQFMRKPFSPGDLIRAAHTATLAYLEREGKEQ